MRSGDTKSGLGVITDETSVSSADRFFDTNRFNRSFGVKIPSIVLPVGSITNTPLCILLITFDASLVVAVIDTDGIFPSPITVRRVGADPPNIWSIKAFIATNWECLLLPVTFIEAVAIISDITSTPLPVDLSCEAALSKTEIASYKHFAMSSSPTTDPSLSSTGKWRNLLSTIISNASRAESSSCTHFGFFVITSLTHTSDGFTNWLTTLLVMSLSVMIPDNDPSSSSNRAASTRHPLILHATSSIELLSGIVTGALGRS